jgi:hypothetical protein
MTVMLHPDGVTADSVHCGERMQKAGILYGLVTGWYATPHYLLEICGILSVTTDDQLWINSLHHITDFEEVLELDTFRHRSLAGVQGNAGYTGIDLQLHLIGGWERFFHAMRNDLHNVFADGQHIHDMPYVKEYIKQTYSFSGRP